MVKRKSSDKGYTSYNTLCTTKLIISWGFEYLFLNVLVLSMLMKNKMLLHLNFKYEIIHVPWCGLTFRIFLQVQPSRRLNWVFLVEHCPLSVVVVIILINSFVTFWNDFHLLLEKSSKETLGLFGQTWKKTCEIVIICFQHLII